MSGSSRNPAAHKGRGTGERPEGRFESTRREAFDDGWLMDDEPSPDPATELFVDHARSVITRNRSPDIPFSQSINPYRGCEHGCVYCYARPAHAYLNLSPGIDFETKIFYKPDAAMLLDRELRKPGYQPEWISLGANTDPWQPVERQLGVTRGILEVLARFRHPVGIVTKGASVIERDIPLLAEMAQRDLVQVAISITTLDADLKRRLEPRAAGSGTRLRVMRRLSEAGVPVMVMFSPVIPFVNDAEMERVLEQAAAAGATHASYVLLRLPHEVQELFEHWLHTHYPARAGHVMSLIRQMRGGKAYDSGFGQRMRGQGAFADVIEQRFTLSCRRFGLNAGRMSELSTAHFQIPPESGDQFSLAL